LVGVLARAVKGGPEEKQETGLGTAKEEEGQGHEWLYNDPGSREQEVPGRNLKGSDCVWGWSRGQKKTVGKNWESQVIGSISLHKGTAFGLENWARRRVKGR